LRVNENNPENTYSERATQPLDVKWTSIQRSYESYI